jgi:hypothetical protein
MAKTTLLNLVDRLIGNVLQGNVYSNLGNYIDKLGTMVPPKDNGTDILSPRPAYIPLNHIENLPSPNPVFVPRGIAQDLQSPNPVSLPDSGLHPLNFNGSEPPHPHSDVAGLNPGRSLFPLSDAIKMHDNRYAFLRDDNLEGKKAAQVPFAKRAEIYNHDPAMPPDVQQQLENVSTPLDTKLPRDQIYQDNRNPQRGPINPPSDVLQQTQGPITSQNPISKNYGPQVPASALNPSIPRDEIYSRADDSIRHAPAGPDLTKQSDNVSKGISPPPDQQIRILDKNDIYANSNYPKASVGSPIGPSSPNLSPSSLPKGRPDSIDDQVKKVGANPDFKKGESFSEVKRNNIYIPSERAKGIVSNIGGTPDSNPTLGDQQALLHKPPAPSLKFKGPNSGDVPNMERLRGFPLVDSAGFPLTDKRDQKAADDLFQKGNFQDSKNPNLADLKNNLYNNGPPSVVNGGPYALTEGFVGPLRNFDIFAIAHWIRNVGSEVMFLPKWSNNADDKKGSFQGPVRSTPPGGPNGAETIVKSTQWLAQNLLLASLNTGDVQAYGPTNLVWNPLSLLTAFLPARGVSPTERPTIGNMIATYKDNLEMSVVASQLSSLNPVGERLLVIRNGLYSQIAPVKRLQQLRSPVMPPGFRGEMNGATNGGDTLDRENPQNLLNIDATIDAQTGGLLEDSMKLRSIHTNLYTAGRPYSKENAILPLEKIESKENEIFYPDNGIPDLKVQTLFQGKPFPGAGFLGTGNDLTFIAKNPLEYFAKKGIKAKDTPDNVDVAFSVLDEDEGVLKQTIGDDENYLPFMFQDLRDETDQYLYLRAFLKSLSETFTPEWNEDRYYGRAEPVPIYKGVIRTINLSFDMVAWGPKDLPILYKKLSKLQSMVYPLYDEKGFFKAGPIIRMRVGDVIATGKDKGLSGYLTALDLNYDKSIWNIKKDFKVPQNIEVSIGFTALHEANPGLYKDPADNKIIFGTGKIKKDGDSYKVEKVSPENIRKIFQSIKGK